MADDDVTLGELVEDEAGVGILRPDAFTRLHPIPDSDAFVKIPADATVAEDGLVEHDFLRKNSIAIRISREMAIDYGLVEPTPHEVEQRRIQSERWKAEEAARRASPGPDLTLDVLLAHLGLTAAYAAHLLHPACHCDPPYADEDPSLCSWARELGFELTEYDDTDDFGRRRVVGP